MADKASFPSVCTLICCAQSLGSQLVVPFQGPHVGMSVFWSATLSTGVKILT